ncbi:ECF-type sigma factor [Marinicella meishanensis]|uniref:ECF-type sigma factor n=1 Tax=Marinicella meishanensis TaxID=2873263 RepID=UPI001CBCE4C0|nr:ECF-type sigma factor [Marinicella sp. NBU2979]
MEQTDTTHINAMIQKWTAGDQEVEQPLFQLLYPLLRRITQKEHRKLNIKAMNTTLLVNEMYLEMKQSKQLIIKNKQHLLSLSARMVRFILIDYLARQSTLKRGGDLKQITWSDHPHEDPTLDVDFLHLHQQLTALDKVDPMAVKIIELRFFAGLNLEETAQTLNRSISHVSREWRFAKTWLQDRLADVKN